jgi:glycine/D-amino acid oxidase-like deaminating enzyme
LVDGAGALRMAISEWGCSSDMNNDPLTHGLWEHSAPAAPECSTLSSRAYCDVVVVGAGYTGLSAALHLAEMGAKVIVLEGQEIGFGGSGRNAGFVNAGMWMMPDDVVAALGDVYGNRLVRQLSDAPSYVFGLIHRHGIDCEAEEAGTIHCAVGEKGEEEILARYRQWRSHGADVTLLDAAETATRTGTQTYRAALLDRRAGTIQPLAYARGLARAAVAQGATLYRQSGARAFSRSGGEWLIESKSGSVTAKSVIIATNAYSESFWPGIRTELARLPYFNLATGPLAPSLREAILPGRQGLWDTKQILSSVRWDKAGRLIIGSVGALKRGGRQVHEAWGRRKLLALFPQLDEVKFEFHWHGWIGTTSNDLPRFHELDEQVYAFAGYNGRGIAPGTIFGRDLAMLVAGQVRPVELSLPCSTTTPIPFRRAKEGIYELGSAAAHVIDARG